MSLIERTIRRLFQGQIDVTSPADGSLLQYNATNTEWVNDTPANIGGDISIGDLSDVDLAGLVSGDALQYDGADFVTKTLTEIIGGLSDWTPNIGGANGLTLTSGSTTTEGKYITIGPITFCFWIGTVRVNSAGGSVTISLPVAKVSPNQQILGSGFRYTSGTSSYRNLICQMVGDTAFLQWEAGAAWTASSDHNVSVQFVYRTT